MSSSVLPDNINWKFALQQRYRSGLAAHVKHGGFTTQSGVLVKPGDTVELEDGTFLRVKRVLHNVSHKEYFVEGWKFWIVHLIDKDHRLPADQALVKEGGSQTIRKRKMRLVNTFYQGHQRRFENADDGVLFCRWSHVIITKTGKLDRPLDAFSVDACEIAEASFERLRRDDCDEDCTDRIADASLHQSWRGSETGQNADIEIRKDYSLPSAIERLSIKDKPQKKETPAPYTFADVCCGAGGASRGAEMAGLRICWALDHDPAACDTYHLNFPHVLLYHEELDDFVSMGRPHPRVDILHGSFPCQAWSRSNTTTNHKKDATNVAANMELGRCLDLASPRIVILEQTSGSMSLGHRQGRHGKIFDNFIKQFTSRGYSVRWKIVNMAEFGLPQFRKRLIMIASCIGEALPNFPDLTHAKYPSTTRLGSFTSVNEVISDIPPGHPNHELPPNYHVPRKPYDGNMPLTHIVMTKGTEDAHPSGLRGFSTRELACLQGFPLEHRFTTTASIKDIKKQIGNAFPSTVAAKLFESVKLHLLIQDGSKHM
ncbi:MAG: hypothetical protein Q9209_005934 [Squamulea sp. 1 TL-2023]